MASILNVDKIRRAAGTTDAITIDSSDRVDAKVPMFHANRSSSYTLTNQSVFVYDNVVFDTDSWYSTSTGRYTPQKAGYYHITGQASLATTTSSDYIVPALRVNGVNKIDVTGVPNASTYPRPQVSGIFYLNGSTDYVEVFVIIGGATAMWQDIRGNNFFGHYLGSGS